ncbi:ABC transporter permease [Methyloversatilis thermotolerans]|uniref:ABC transporter permease n=1 Tax=Methyloversatilis thermotolerans TaxID=1346290 RepID=UPI0003A9F8A7|nr:ABC transporter permease [Methyloversatilis thermotolerans]
MIRTFFSGLGRHVLQALVLALVVSTACFAMLRTLPGDPAYRVAAGRYGYDNVSVRAAEAVRAELALDRPWPEALIDWWGRVASLDFGLSMVTGEPVMDELVHHLGHTLWLAALATVLAWLIGLPFGILAGLRPGGWIDRACLLITVLLRAAPPFLIAIALVVVFSVQLGALPAAGHRAPSHVLLPALALALALAGGTARVAREAVVDVIRSPYFDFALSRGLSSRQALWRHGLRNAALPLLEYGGMQLVLLVEGVVVVETLFAWPGLGHALVHALFWRDVPTLQASVLVLALAFVLFHALVDWLCRLLDPRRKRVEQP